MRKHQLVKLHKDILTISFKERMAIKKAMKEILGLFYIDHMALDIVDPDSIMTFLSSTPTTGFNVCSTSLWEHDGSISPTYYQNHSFYWWDDAYHEEYIEKIKGLKEYRHGFSKGFMLVRKVNDFYILYSFGTKSKNPSIKEKIQLSMNDYLKVGDYLFNELRSVYQNYVEEHEVPSINTFVPFTAGKPIEQFSDHHLRKDIKLVVNNPYDLSIGSGNKIITPDSKIHQPQLHIITNMRYDHFINQDKKS